MHSFLRYKPLYNLISKNLYQKTDFEAEFVIDPYNVVNKSQHRN